MDRPIFSIIILNTDNNIELLSATIQSAIDQDFERWDCLVLSLNKDVSKDISGHFGQDSRINFIEEENGNTGFLKNSGISNTNGRYVLFLSAGDNFINNRTLSEINTKIEPRDELIYTAVSIDDSPCTRPVYPFTINYLLDHTDLNCFFIYNRVIFDKYPRFNERLSFYTDWELIVRLISLGRVQQLYLPEILFNRKPLSAKRNLVSEEKERDKILSDLFSLEFLQICQTHPTYKSFYFRKDFQLLRTLKRRLGFLFSPSKWKEYIYKKRITPLIRLTNKTIRAQEKDPLSIPVIIINYNRLADLEKLVSFLLKRKHKNIVVVDNGSTYPPLLEYYEKIKNKVTIKIMNYNYGHLVFWRNPELYKEYSNGYHIVTDFDIIPNEELPENYVGQLISILNTHKHVTKVGFALRIDDLPKERLGVIPWEQPFWDNPIGKDLYRAAIDTTFALYPPKYKFSFGTFYNAIRVGGNFTARHGGFYIVDTNLSEEDIYYFETANASSTWKGYANTNAKK